MNGLKNCPFCGEEMNEIEMVDFLGSARIHHADVLKADSNCLMHYFTIMNVSSIKEAKAKWNKRANGGE